MADDKTSFEAAQPTTQEGSLAAAKAKFNELVAKQAAEPDLGKPLQGQETPSSKRPRKAPPKALEAAEEPEAVEAEPDEKPAPKEPQKHSEADRLRAKLLLAGNPKKAIESLSDDEVGEWWKKQEEREQTTALAIQRASDLEKQVAPKQAASKSEPLAGVPTDELDLEEFTATLADQFGEEEAGVLAKAFSVLIEPLQRENREFRTILDNARDFGAKQIEKSNRERLGGKLDMLKSNDRAWAMLNAAVQTDIQKEPKKHSSVEGFFDDVFESLYGDMITEKATVSEDDKAEEKARIAASSHTPPSSTKRQRAFTPMDAHKAVFEHLVKNSDDTEGARKVYGRYSVQ